MPPPKGGRAGGGGGKGLSSDDRVEAKQPLTAVLLADSFTQRFRPITVEKPKVLLPLVNAPLLEYTLEWLAGNGVEEIVVFCCAHADQIKAHLADSKWPRQRSPRVVTVTATNCLSLGEALRALDQKDVVKGTFVLVSGDTVCNMDLAPVLREHKERAERDKDAVMTMVMKPAASPLQRLRLGDAGTVVALDGDTRRLLKYAELGADGSLEHRHHHHHHGGGGGGVGSGSAAAAAAGSAGALQQQQRRAAAAAAGAAWKLDAALWGERDRVVVRGDLLDTCVSVCSHEVLMMFTDNFDYQSLKRDFVAGTLSEEELGKKIYVHVLQGEYAARVHNLRAYDAVSRDLLARWAFPFAPDTNVFSRGGHWGPSTYRYARGQRYLEAVTSISRAATLGPCVAVGAGAAVGDGSRLSHCVVGRGCAIGRNVTLVGCFLHDGVVVGDGVTATHALLCEGVVVCPGATLSPGVVLSFNVVVGPRHTVPANAVVTLCKHRATTVSLSDDELEYSSAGRQSSSGGGAAGAAGGGGAGASRRRQQQRRRLQQQQRQQQRQRRRGGSSSGSETDDDSDSAGSGSSSSSSSSGFGDDDADELALEKPSQQVLRVAKILASGDKDAKARAGPQVLELGFDTALVGDGGAGYGWPVDPQAALLYSLAPPPLRQQGLGGVGGVDEADLLDDDAVLDGDGDGGGAAGASGSAAKAAGRGPRSGRGEPRARAAAGASDSGDADGSSDAADAHASQEGDDDGGGGGGGAGASYNDDPEAVFMREVAETFLRCVKERFAEVNAVIELNGLKIAEDRSFADCARYILTTLLQLCLPAPAWTPGEYRSLFPSDAPDAAAREGKLALLSRFSRQLGEWGALLRRFLRSEDDQVELLLTLEEFCAEEGVFEPPPPPPAGSSSGRAGATKATTAGGAAFAPLFANVLQQLYDGDVVEEGAIVAWADEKAHADEEDKVFLRKAAPFLEWLKTADEDEDDASSSDADDSDT